MSGSEQAPKHVRGTSPCTPFKRGNPSVVLTTPKGDLKSPAILSVSNSGRFERLIRSGLIAAARKKFTFLASR